MKEFDNHQHVFLNLAGKKKCKVNEVFSEKAIESMHSRFKLQSLNQIKKNGQPAFVFDIDKRTQ
jgi:hypothetical protein